MVDETIIIENVKCGLSLHVLHQHLKAVSAAQFSIDISFVTSSVAKTVFGNISFILKF